MMRPDPSDFSEQMLAKARRNAAAIMAIPIGAREGTIGCPICRRPLHYEIRPAGVRAYCETPGCVALPE